LRPRRLVLALALCALAALPALADGLPEPARLVVRALDWNGHPVAGATVQLAVQPEKEDAPDAQVWTAETSASGRARLSGLPAGEQLWLVVERSGLVAEARAVVLRPGERRRLRVELGPGGLASGRVVDEEGRPVDGAEVQLESEAFGRFPSYLPAIVRAQAFRTARTDGAGRFQLRDLPKGDLEIEILHPAYLPFSEGSPIQRQRDLGDLLVRRGATLTGRVTDPSGQPVPGVAVWIAPTNSAALGMGQEPATRTGPDGSFSIPNLRQDDYMLSLCSRGTLDESTSVTLLDEPLELTVRPAATLQGRVLAPDGRPAAGAEVMALQVTRWEPLEPDFSPCPQSNWDGWIPGEYYSTPDRARAVTDGEGHFTAGPLEGGWYDLLVLTSGMDGYLEALRVEPGQALAGLEVATEPEEVDDDSADEAPETTKEPGEDAAEPEPALALLGGRVVGPQGRPIAGALVQGDPGQTWTDAAGRFELRIADGKESHLDVSKPGFATVQMSVTPAGSPVEIRLRAGVTLLGRVLNLIPEDRHPVLVFFHWPGSGEYGPMVRAQADGTFRAENLPPETLNVYVQTGERTLNAEIELAPGNTEVRADFELPPVTLVSGRALDDLGNPVGRARVFAQDSKFNSRDTDSRADGSFALYLDPGRYTISADRDGFSRVSQEVEVADLPVGGLELRLSTPKTLHGHLLGLAPGERVRLELRRPGSGTSRPALADLDRFQITDVEEGAWEIEAEAWIGEWSTKTSSKILQTFEIPPGTQDMELDLDLGAAPEKEP
jgi:protocatechuate 3,4-dioxygenase beta subunit